MRWEEYQFDGDGQSDSTDRQELRPRTHLSEEGMEDDESLVCQTDAIHRQCFSKKVDL